MLYSFRRTLQGSFVVRGGILLFWTMFWLFNVVDKFIAGPQFLFVGRDRFAQVIKFWNSIGIQDPFIPNASLIFASLLELAAFVFAALALMQLFREKEEEAQTLFFWCSFAGLAVFSFFAIGDQIFGDRFELLEHTLFWITIIASWGAYVYYPERMDRTTVNLHHHASLLFVSGILILVLGAIMTWYQIKYVDEHFNEHFDIVEPRYLGEGVYAFELPHLANRGVWERSLVKFIADHPELQILDIYTMPSQLKSKKDNAVIWIITEQRR